METNKEIEVSGLEMLNKDSNSTMNSTSTVYTLRLGSYSVGRIVRLYRYAR
jgi:hypothetical protein